MGMEEKKKALPLPLSFNRQNKPILALICKFVQWLDRVYKICTLNGDGWKKNLLLDAVTALSTTLNPIGNNIIVTAT